MKKKDKIENSEQAARIACAKKTSIGGQALMEGIMMRGPKKSAMAVRNPQGEIVLEVTDIVTGKRPVIAKIPIIRGVYNFASSMLIGYKALMRSAEISGLEEIEEEMAREKAAKKAACIPGNSTSYVAHYGYSEMGFEFFSGDDIYDKINYRPIYNCNTVSLHYARSLDGVMFRFNGEDEIKNFIDETARGKHTMVFYHHPQRSYCKSFWNADNFNKKNTPREEWIKCDIHDDADTERFYENFRAFVRLLRDDGDFNVITYAELANKLRESERALTFEGLRDVYLQLKEKFFPVTLPNSYSIADIFLACRDLLLGKNEHICGRVYGFLSEPYSSPDTVTLTRDEALELAKSIDEDSFLPSVFEINGKKIGPCELLHALLAFLFDGADTYTVTPFTEWQIDLDEFPSLRDLNYKGSWIHSNELLDSYLSDRLRLQSWTIRLPKGTARTIF